MRTSHRRGRHPLLVLVLLTLGLVGPVTLIGSNPASAGPVYQAYDADNDPYSGIYLRNGTTMGNVSRTADRYVTYGTSIELLCGAWGEAVGPNGNRRWHQVRVTNGPNVNRQGWIADRYTNTPNRANEPTPGETECGAQPAPPPTGTHVAQDAQLRLCVNTANAGCVPPGMPVVRASSAVRMVCWQKGSSTHGTDQWFWVTTAAGEGFVNANLVRNQSNVGWCLSTKAFVAADAAVARHGQVWASETDRNQFSASEWAPGPAGEWAGDCPKLPYVGWRAAGVTIVKNDAIQNYRHYSNAGRIRSGVPPRGAVVFYDVTRYGHTAISLGRGFVASTVGMDNDKAANSVRPYTAWANYLGWAMPA